MKRRADALVRCALEFPPECVIESKNPHSVISWKARTHAHSVPFVDARLCGHDAREFLHTVLRGNDDKRSSGPFGENGEMKRARFFPTLAGVRVHTLKLRLTVASNTRDTQYYICPSEVHAGASVGGAYEIFAPRMTPVQIICVPVGPAYSARRTNAPRGTRGDLDCTPRVRHGK